MEQFLIEEIYFSVMQSLPLLAGTVDNWNNFQKNPWIWSSEQLSSTRQTNSLLGTKRLSWKRCIFVFHRTKNSESCLDVIEAGEIQDIQY